MKEKKLKIMSEKNKQLRIGGVGNRYRVGYDSSSDGSQQAYALWDRKKNRLRYITNKKWKVKLGLFVARLFGWQIIVER